MKLRFCIFFISIFFVANCLAETTVNNSKIRFAKSYIENSYKASTQAVRNLYRDRILNPTQAFAQGVTNTRQKLQNGVKAAIPKVKMTSKGAIALGGIGLVGKFAQDSAKGYGYCLNKREQGIVDMIDRQDSQQAVTQLAGYDYVNQNKLDSRACRSYKEYLLNHAIEKKDIAIITSLLEYKYPEQAREIISYPVGKQVLDIPKLQLVAMQLCGLDTVTGKDSVSKQMNELQSVLKHKEINKRKPFSIDISRFE